MPSLSSSSSLARTALRASSSRLPVMSAAAGSALVVASRAYGSRSLLAGGTSTSSSARRSAQRSPFLPAPSSRRTLFVQTQTTPNPNSLQFIPGTPVLSSGGTHEFLNLKAALASPLALKLMGIEGVASVFYGPDFVSVQKDDETPWAVIKPEVFSLVMEHFSSGAPLFKDQQQPGVGDDGEPEDTRILDSDSEVVATVKELIATRIRPSIMEDGGDLEFKGFDEQMGVVRVKLKGSCRGCSSSEVTLKSGIERMLMHYVPEVTTVEQILDDEEVVALDEFAKFEARLAEKASKAAATDSSSSAV